MNPNAVDTYGYNQGGQPAPSYGYGAPYEMQQQQQMQPGITHQYSDPGYSYNQYQQQQQQPQYYNNQQQQPYYPSNGTAAPPTGAYGGGGGTQPTDNISGDPQYNDANYTQGVPLYNMDTTTGPQKNKFVTQGCKDVWAAILFLILTIATIVWAIYNLATYFDWGSTGLSEELEVEDWGGNGDNGDVSLGLLLTWGGIGLGSGIILGIFSLFIFYCVPKPAIIVANVAMVLIAIGFAIWTFAVGNWIAGIVLLVLGLLRGLMLWLGRHMIPFSAALMRESTRILKHYPMVTISNFIWVIINAIWGTLYMACIYPTIRKTWYEDDPSVGLLFIVYLFAVFALYWTSQVVFNITHVVVSGVTCTWYFFGANSMPSNPTWHSTRRALTTSFGSICFGSLLVALIKTVRAIVRAFARENSNNCCAAFCFCIIDCILGCIESLLEMFNHFAFVFVAMYGCSYLDAARLTKKHVNRSVWAPLFANALVTSTLFFFALAFGMVMAVIAYFASGGTSDDNEWQSYLMAAICGFCAMSSMGLFFHAIDSCVTAFQVCLAEEPSVVAVTNPEFAADLNGMLEEYKNGQAPPAPSASGV